MAVRDKTCCFTGHRQLKCRHEVLQLRLEEAIIAAIEDGIVNFCAGGAIGFDMLAQQTVLLLKERYPQIKLILVLPCKDQERLWNDEQKRIYYSFIEAADKTVTLANRYYSGCMHARNRALVNASSRCICYLSKKTGGTAYTVDFAKQEGLEIVNLY